MTAPQITRLPDGRLHLHHGPIDIVLTAEGPDAARARDQAARRFAAILPELVAELPALRRPDPPPLRSAIAQAMAGATAAFRPDFITPMAAVAGAVADAVLAAMLAGNDLTRAIVNNGGDIAFHLAPGHQTTAAIARSVNRSGIGADRVTIRAADPVRGIATSGWRGRSQSLGIADAVTVLAPTAAMADAAATMIANAVNLPGHPAITRRPAHDLKADSDLGPRLVTTGVGPLSDADIARALTNGVTLARRLHKQGLVTGAALFLQSQALSLGLPTPNREPCLA
ncbi:UPF0280 family protein [Szabonella alba]|uniref:UPF0280 family protein n=1 Tax=Szabonella alba TaxID=2804194 RepID=A0A8K0XYX6_9RHOB|nr:UPF0280 family protein [Szabonella alba]MBL4916515.1 UPF0280 family protein [Szabonella alba]